MSANAGPASVHFPVTESPQKHAKPASPLRAPHLPFRRISLPTAPSPQHHRVSVVSVASFDSLPEGDGDGESPQGGRTLARVLEQPSQERPPSVDPHRRRKRVRDSSTKPTDERQTSRKRKIVEEFYETEKAYVDGLELIYSHFLTPIISSLDTPEPLLNRSALTSVFSNFIDIWNLHRSFLYALTSLLEPIHTQLLSTPQSSTKAAPPLPELSPLLLAHFPYLSLYTPFVTAFPATISSLNELVTPPTTTRPSQYNQQFAEFLNAQESDPRCGKLKLRDWLLTIVQRCPRYLLLLKDLINATSRDDPEHSQLTVVHSLVSKITLSLNTSLHTHAQTMSLLALQRATPNLPFQLISPGRTLLKRGSLFQIERSGTPIEREFLLFSDCMIWLAPAEVLGQSWDWSWSGSGSAASVTQSNHNTPVGSKFSVERQPMTRTRSKSDAELLTRQTDTASADGSSRDTGETSLPSTPNSRGKSVVPSDSPPPIPNMVKRNYSADDKWSYKGRIELVDTQVIVGSALEDERKFEILSPEGSFVLYAGSEAERDEWASEIRAAKSQLLMSLNLTNPNSTLTSSASTKHVRRALQALPYHPDEEHAERVRASSSLDVVGSAGHHHRGRFKIGKKDKEKHGLSERRRKVDHWVPAIWIPDGKTTSCMRCGRTFGWRRRRHHCRLCGRCVCAACSERTFYISDSNSNQETKPARACNACYESVFPIIDSDGPDTHDEDHDGTVENRNTDTITSLSGLPSWLSMPALPVQRQPHALMTIDLNSSHDMSSEVDNINDIVSGTDERDRRPRLRVRSHQRLRSYKQIMEDFQVQADSPHRNSGSKDKPADNDDTDHNFDGQGEYDDEDGEEDHINIWYTPTHSLASSPVSSPRKQRREDTARRSKRFSLPAIALQTTSVTARTSDIPDSASLSRQTSSTDLSAGLGRSKRFSLVLAAGSGRNRYVEGSNKATPGNEEGGEAGIPRSVAAARLSELLGRKTKS
ncbi:hypothetical protein BDN70DRAFT_878635 [Pholiota conissans]|uniref:Uncharacterized protein n=1 Tax=Pholiota conissans TaxID=109636 RepID=A0A9P6D0P5_9AGAR|nr:hypothetical protein BDN70DRAFT_878635 [Pholiota conissans]